MSISSYPKLATSVISFLAVLGLLVGSLPAYAAPMDARLNMAKRLLIEIEQGIGAIKPGDVSRYNALSAKLTKTGDMLKQTESKSHPDYLPAIQQWGALQKAMVSTAQQWQSASESHAASPTRKTPKVASQRATQVAQVSGDKVNPDQILERYQRSKRPKLAANATPEDARVWASALQKLRTTQLQQDLAALNSTGVSAADRDRVSRWISGTFQQQIAQDLRQALDQSQSAITMGLQLAQQIQGIPDDDKMRAYNFANGSNGANNAQTLENGMRSVMVARAIAEAAADLASSDYADELRLLANTQNRFETMREGAEATGEKLAKMPKKQAPKRTNFLAPIEQEFWLRGSVFASIDAKGNVWIGSDEVGDIEINGKIWVRGNRLGSIEPNGEVWFRGNSIGSLEDNGEVWRAGNQVGLIDNTGKVWIGGNANGEITPYQGEWKRAAILYYFSDLFAD